MKRNSKSMMTISKLRCWILCNLIILQVASTNTNTNNPISNWEEWQPLAKIDNFLNYIDEKHDYVNIEDLEEKSGENKTMRVVKVN